METLLFSVFLLYGKRISVVLGCGLQLKQWSNIYFRSWPYFLGLQTCKYQLPKKEMMAFFYVKANTLLRGVYYANSTGTKAGVTDVHCIDLEGNMHCFMCPVSSCYIRISVVFQCRIFVCSFGTDSTCTCQTDAALS